MVAYSSLPLQNSRCLRALSRKIAPLQWLKSSLMKSGKCALPGKKMLLKSEVEFEVVLVDAAESPIERPKKKVRQKKRIKNRKNKQKHYYSGKKKRHILKSQVVVDKKSKAIICTSFSNGKTVA